MIPNLPAISVSMPLSAILLLSLFPFSSVLAHTFSPNESASFLSLVDQIKSALLTIKDDVSSNIRLAKEQGQYARMLVTDSVIKELKERNQRIATKLPQMLDSLQNVTPQNVNSNVSIISDVLAEALTVRIQKDQLKNVTVQALAFANDINKILDEYTAAFKEGNASQNMNMTNGGMSSMKVGNSSMSMATDTTPEEIVKDVAVYQRAGALTDIAIDRFNTELTGKSNVRL